MVFRQGSKLTKIAVLDSGGSPMMLSNYRSGVFTIIIIVKLLIGQVIGVSNRLCLNQCSILAIGKPITKINA